MFLKLGAVAGIYENLKKWVKKVVVAGMLVYRSFLPMNPLPCQLLELRFVTSQCYVYGVEWGIVDCCLAVYYHSKNRQRLHQ